MSFNQDTIGLIKQRLEILWQLVESLETGGGGSGDAYTKAQTDALLNGKVDKVAGSSLMTTAQANKLAGIESGAEVNVQANWNETNVNADSYILNKPTIPDLTNYYNKTETDAEIQGAITDLDVPSTSTTGHYIKSIAQVDGLIEAVPELADTTPAIGSSRLITSGAVYTGLSSKASTSSVSTLSSEVNVVAKVAKNKFYRQLDRPSTATDNNVTITYQSDNSIVLSGTASA